MGRGHRAGTVLVTGAAGGRQGSTGRLVARLLSERGVPVRAFVHHLDERAEDLRRWGAEVVEGDLLDLAAVRAAWRGAPRAFFAYPVQEGLLEASATFAQAAREAGAELVVNLSQLLNRAGPQPTPHQQRHWLSEQVFDWAAVGTVHLNAPVFYENLRALARGSLAGAGVIALPWGPEDTKIPMIAAEDVARVAAGLLGGPRPAPGTVVPLVGSVVTVGEIADAFSALLHRHVAYVQISDEQWLEHVSGAGVNAAALEHLSHLWRYLRTRPREVQAAYRVTSAIETLGGAPPKTLAQFLAEQRQHFTDLAADG